MADPNPELWGWVIPRGGKKKPVILDSASHDEISAICEEEIPGLGYFPLYTLSKAEPHHPHTAEKVTQGGKSE